MPINGTLADFSVEQILRLLALSEQTGTLQVRTPRQSARLEVTTGAVTAARSGDEEGEAALGAILGGRAGTFSFRPGRTGARMLHGELDELLARARAAAEELAQVRADIPDDRVRFTLSARATAGASFALTPDDLRVLMSIDGRRDVRAVATRAKYPRAKALRHLHRLLREGLIQAAEASGVPIAIQAIGPPAPAKDRRRGRKSEPESVEPVAPAEPVSAEELAEGLDLRLAALATPDAAEAIVAHEPARQAEMSTGSLIVVTPAPAEPAAVSATPAAEATVIFKLHYLPPGVAPPELEMDKPVAPGPRRGLFGLFRLRSKRAPTGGAEAPDLDIPSPAELAAFANALFDEYRRTAEAQAELAGGPTAARAEQRFAEGIPPRLQRIYAKNPIGRRLPVRDGEIDVDKLRDGDYAPGQVLPYLAQLVRQLRDDAEAVWGREEARGAYQAVVARVFGGSAIPTPTAILHRAATRPSARIVIRSGGAGGPFDLGPRTYHIGRSSSCDIVLSEVSVSGRHARLTPELDAFRIIDLGSTNGTFVNGERLTGDRLLQGGDVIRIGDATLSYELLPHDAAGGSRK